jgi:hypothetical protein
MTLISKSFELRGFSRDSKANGETDFKGPTEFYDTGGRLEYLKAYAKEARAFFGETAWDQLAVSEEQVSKSLAGLKPQPQPTVRQHLDDTNGNGFPVARGCARNGRLSQNSGSPSRGED